MCGQTGSWALCLCGVLPVSVALVGADSRFSSQDFGVGMISCRFCVVVVYKRFKDGLSC